MPKNPTYYITAAIPYANGAPHIGHAYEVIAADALARFKRLDGYKVRFQTGMDEHGQKIEQEARKQNCPPQQLVDKVSAQFRALYDALGITYDDFIRTTEPRHKTRVQELWKRMMATGDIYLDKYVGWYSVRDEAYFDETELKESTDGKKLAPSGAPVEWVEEESYFFRLSKYQDKLLKLYEDNPTFIQPNTRRNEVISFVKSGLKDLSVSRTTFKWSIEVPDQSKHVMYVWVDALSNYITALGYPGQGDENFKQFWPADLHMIGKDIVRFHAVYWPAFLMSLGIELPKKVYGHGLIYNRGEKMSKSVGNVIAPLDLVNQYGLDPVRFFLLREVAFGQDGDFTHDAMVRRMNSDLANDLGNLAQRSLSMINKNCEGKVPQPSLFNESDLKILGKGDELLSEVRREVDNQSFHKVLEMIWSLVGDANRYVDEMAPWGLKKTDPIRMATVLYVLAETVRRLAILCQPFIPGTMDKLLDQLSVSVSERSFSALDKNIRIKSGTSLPVPLGVFPRYVEPEATQAS